MTDSRSVDYLVMLLSSDWFFDYWAAIGIGLPKVTKTRLQKGCRSIVRQLLLVQGKEVREYYHVNFSNERIVATRASFMELLDNCNLVSPESTNILFAINSKKKYESPSTLELLENCTELLVTARWNELGIPLDGSIALVLTEAAKRKSPAETDFCELDLDSSTTWDLFVRSLSPDIPTFLSDLISVDQRCVSKLDYTWCLACEQLTSKQQETLLNWYRAVVQKISGETLKLSSLRLAD